MQPPHSPVVPIEIGPISQFYSLYNYIYESNILILLAYFIYVAKFIYMKIYCHILIRSKLLTSLLHNEADRRQVRITMQ